MNLVQSTAYLGMFMKVAANMLGKTYTRYLHGLSWTCKQDQFFKEFFFFLLFTTIYLPNIYEDILHKCSVTRNQGTKRKFLVLSSESHLIWFKLQRKETLSRAVGDAPSLSLLLIEEICKLKKKKILRKPLSRPYQPFWIFSGSVPLYSQRSIARVVALQAVWLCRQCGFAGCVALQAVRICRQCCFAGSAALQKMRLCRRWARCPRRHWAGI